MKKRIVVTVCAVSLFTVGCDAAPADENTASVVGNVSSELKLPLRIDPTSSSSDSTKIYVAAQALEKTCPLLVEHRADLDSVHAQVREALGFYRTMVGWTRYVALEVKISDDTDQLPPELRAQGHTCHYWFGGGASPSMRVTKGPCKALCSLSPDEPADGGDAVIRLPSMQVIEPPPTAPATSHSITKEQADSIAAASLAADAAGAREPTPLDSANVRTSEGEGTARDYLILEAAALQGNYQAQRNWAYTLSQDRQVADPIRACAWRLVILQSGHSSADESDRSNKELACDRKLSPSERETAATQALELMERLRAR